MPYLGLTFDITPSQSLYASYTSIFEPQSSRDYYNNYIDPILGNNYEIGWKGEWFDRALNTSIAFFQINQENRAFQVMGPRYDGKGTSYWEPWGEVRSRGLEAEISGNLTDNWKIFGGYTFNETEYRKSETTARQAGMSFSRHTPKHMLRLYTNYKLPWGDERWTIGGGVNWQSDVESAWGVKQGSYAVWNANIQYDVTDNIKLALIGKNIFDKRYFLTTNNRNGGMNGFFGEPFNLMLKVSWKW